MVLYTMPAILLRFSGAGLLSKFMRKALRAATDENRRAEWFVVSTVVYGEVLEWHTPHWRVAIHVLADQIEFSGEEQQNMFNAMVAGGSIGEELAFRLKATVKDLILAHDLIDTGNYIGSIAMGPTHDEAMSQSDFQLLDPTTSVFAI